MVRQQYQNQHHKTYLTQFFMRSFPDGSQVQPQSPLDSALIPQGKDLEGTDDGGPGDEAGLIVSSHTHTHPPPHTYKTNHMHARTHTHTHTLAAAPGKKSARWKRKAKQKRPWRRLWMHH